jgi:hypothetical protein
MLVECVDRIRPDRVQLNTVARPPAESRAIAVSRQRMHELAARFKPPAEVLGRFRGSEDTPETALDRDLICDLLRRRPCTPEDIAAGLGVHLVEVVKHLEELADQGLLVQTWSGGRLYCHPAGSCVPPDLTLNQGNPNRTSHG